jgi:hypothetical protein
MSILPWNIYYNNFLALDGHYKKKDSFLVIALYFSPVGLTLLPSLTPNKKKLWQLSRWNYAPGLAEQYQYAQRGRCLPH